MSVSKRPGLPFSPVNKYKLSLASSVTPGYRLEPIPLRSHLNLACEFEESISGSFTLDNQVNKNLNGSNGQLSNNHNESFHHDAKKPTFGHDSQLIFDSLDSKNQDNAPPPTMKIKLPKLVKQFGAEVLGTFLLVLFGDAAIAQVALGSKFGDMGGFASICFGYGFALMIGILVSGGVSGGHLNPAVTLSMAILKKCRWIQVPVYWIAQYLGALLAALFVYGNYYEAMVDQSTGSSANTSNGYTIFASYPNGNYDPSNYTLAFDQMLGTALLVIIILAVTDEKNMKIPAHLAPLFIGFGLCAIHLSFGLNAGCAVNPARDFSPRLFTLMAGWDGSKTFGEDSKSFFWIPWLLPHVGGVFGAGVYQLLVAMHHEEE